MNEAIKLAIDGGWKPDEDKLFSGIKANCVISPLFWQALGKSLGWEQPEDKYHWVQINQEGVSNGIKFFQGDLMGESRSGVSYLVRPDGKKTKITINKKYIELSPRNEWRRVWRHLIDHLIEGKDIDSFFQELLANKK